MKKSLIVVSALASTFAMVAAPVVVPALGMSTFAAETETAGTDDEINAARKKVTELISEIKQKFPEAEKWSAVEGIMFALENQYGCTGKGCAAEEELKGGTKITAALEADKIDFTKMNTMEALAAVKNTTTYKSNAELREYVALVESEAKDVIFGGEYNGDYNLMANLPADFDKEAAKKMSYVEILTAVKDLPGYKQYTDLGKQLSTLEMYNSMESSTLEQLNSAYDAAVSALAATETFVESQKPVEPTPEQTESINELEKFIAEVTEDPTYQKYERLVYQARYAEDLLAAMRDPSIDLGGKGGDDAGVPAAQAETNSEVTYAEEAAEAINAIGDAMRAIGIKTELGKGLTTATADELEAALQQAKAVDKFQEYSDLVDAVETAAAALANGSTDVAELKKALEAIKTAVKVLVPDTGIAANKSIDADAAIETTTSLIVLATVAVLVGAAVVTKRNLVCKNR